MNDDAHEFGGAPILIGDMNVDGRVYMGAAGGRGLIYWDSSSVTLSTDDISKKSDFSIAFSPNPFTTNFKVDATQTNEPIRVSIFDITGKRMQEEKSISESGQLLMGSSLQPGLYIVKVEGVNSNFSKSFKVLKK
jgi:hypothetical protein